MRAKCRHVFPVYFSTCMCMCLCFYDFLFFLYFLFFHIKEKLNHKVLRVSKKKKKKIDVCQLLCILRKCWQISLPCRILSSFVAIYYACVLPGIDAANSNTKRRTEKCHPSLPLAFPSCLRCIVICGFKRRKILFSADVDVVIIPGLPNVINRVLLAYNIP